MSKKVVHVIQVMQAIQVEQIVVCPFACNTRNASNTSVGIAHNSRDAISASNVRT